MEQQQLDLILDTLIQPQGLFSIYSAWDIGERSPDTRIKKLNSLEEYQDIGDSFGLEMKYLIDRENINFQLLATSPSTSFPNTFNWKTMTAKLFRRPEVLRELGNFSYSHDQTVELGKAVLHGKEVGPLEHEVLRECLARDSEHELVRHNVGNYLVAIGEFAQRLAKRSLDVSVTVDVPYYAKLKRTG